MESRLLDLGITILMDLTLAPLLYILPALLVLPERGLSLTVGVHVGLSFAAGCVVPVFIISMIEWHLG